MIQDSNPSKDSEKKWGECDDQVDFDSVKQTVNDFYEADIKIIK